LLNREGVMQIARLMDDTIDHDGAVNDAIQDTMGTMRQRPDAQFQIGPFLAGEWLIAQQGKQSTKPFDMRL
jgi:hypothetical protein